MASLNYHYPADLTGRSPANYVHLEPHLLVEYSGLDVRLFQLNHGGFYTRDLLVYDQNGIELRPYRDYIATFTYEDISDHTGLEVCGVIVVLNPAVEGIVRVSAQMVGADLAFDLGATEKVIEHILLHPGVDITWAGIVGRPREFGPGELDYEPWYKTGYPIVNRSLEELTHVLKSGNQPRLMEYRDAIVAEHNRYVNEVILPTQAPQGRLLNGFSDPVAISSDWPGGSTDGVGKLAYSPSLNVYVAIHLYRGLWFSDNLTVWQTDPQFYDVAFHDVCWANSVFIAVGHDVRNDRGVVARSEDGVSWTYSSTGVELPQTGGLTNYKFQAVAYGGGRWVIASANGRVFVSTNNGVSWLERERTFTGGVVDLAFGNGVWVLANSPHLYTTTDFVTFTEQSYTRSPNSQIGVFRVAFTDGWFIAVENCVSPALVHISNNGSDWIRATMGSQFENPDVTVWAHAGWFYLIEPQLRIHQSKDLGRTWRLIKTDNPSVEAIGTVLVDGESFIVGSRRRVVGDEPQPAFHRVAHEYGFDALGDHIYDYDNPHDVTKAQVGLGLVENFPPAVPPNTNPLPPVSTPWPNIDNETYMTPYAAARLFNHHFLPPLRAHIADRNNPHRDTAHNVGTYLRAEVDAIAATKLGVNETAVNAQTIVFQGVRYTFTQFIDVIRRNIPASEITMGVLGRSLLGTGVASGDTVLTGAGQWVSVSTLARQYAPSGGAAIYYAGFLVNDGNALAHIGATYANSSVYPVGTIVLYRVRDTQAFYIGDDEGEIHEFQSLRGAIRTAGGWNNYGGAPSGGMIDRNGTRVDLKANPDYRG